ncbi:MAG: hypothetical protein ACRCZB_09745 [Bacteroidales bacterium]
MMARITSLLLAVSTAIFVLSWAKERTITTEKQRQIKELHTLIERVSGEKISIEINNHFKNTAVFGKAVSTVHLENNAKMQAAIIKRELENYTPPVSLGREVKIPFKN